MMPVRALHERLRCQRLRADVGVTIADQGSPYVHQKARHRVITFRAQP
jgi:hypothetical protein